MNRQRSRFPQWMKALLGVLAFAGMCFGLMMVLYATMNGPARADGPLRLIAPIQVADNARPGGSQIAVPLGYPANRYAQPGIEPVMHSREVIEALKEVQKLTENDEGYAKAKQALSDALAEELKQQQDRYEAEIADAQRRVDKLKRTLAARKDAKDKIIDRRIDELLGTPEILRWQPSYTDQVRPQQLLPNARIPNNATQLLPTRPITPPMQYVAPQTRYAAPVRSAIPEIYPPQPRETYRERLATGSDAYDVPYRQGFDGNQRTVDVPLPGSIEVKSLKPVTRFRVADPTICEVSPVNGTVLKVKALKLGKTPVVLWDRDDNISVWQIVVDEHPRSQRQTDDPPTIPGVEDSLEQFDALLGPSDSLRSPEREESNAQRKPK